MVSGDQVSLGPLEGDDPGHSSIGSLHGRFRTPFDTVHALGDPGHVWPCIPPEILGPGPRPRPGRTAKGGRRRPRLSRRRGVEAGGPPISPKPDTGAAARLFPRCGRTGSPEVGLKDPNDVQKHSLRFVIAAVPEPVRSTNSHRFDEWIDSIQLPANPKASCWAGSGCRGIRATSAKDRSPARSPGRVQARDEARDGVNPCASRAGPAPLPRPKKPEDNTPILAVLLVPESPTLGLDKVTLSTCLDLAAAWDVDNRREGETRTIRILGPIYSGSQDSLEQTLRSWTSGPGRARTGPTRSRYLRQRVVHRCQKVKRVRRPAAQDQLLGDGPQKRRSSMPCSITSVARRATSPCSSRRTSGSVRRGNSEIRTAE